MRMALPLMATFVLESLPTLLALAILGHLEVPEVQDYVSAAALSTMLTTVTGISVGNGLISAMDTLSSQAVGAKKPELLGLHLRTGVLVVGAAYVLMVLINVNAQSILEMLGQDARVASLAGAYSRITIFGLPGLFLYELAKRTLLAQNIASPMVHIALLSNGIYVALAYILCYHSSLGFYGAAFAWLVSYWSLALLTLLYLCVSSAHRSWALETTSWRQASMHAPAFLQLGAAGMAMMLMEWWAFELMALFAGMLVHPAVAISVHAIVANVSSSVYSIFLGVSVATGVRVGQLIGADNVTHAKHMSALGLGLTAATGVLVALVLVAARAYIPKWIVNDPRTIAQAQHTLLVLAIFEVLDGVNCTAKGILRAMGKQHLGVYVSLLAYYVVGVPLAALVGLYYAVGVAGLWVGLAAGVSFSALTLTGIVLYPRNWSTIVNHATKASNSLA
ncbi:hypothetical protein SPRG_13686 [Saprolegnia parasitica CBS 223.65]|uniref:MATE efflux family protein n=1 Tax=Saprolegnia parasitica (strain CBS 223.65) TaxID=695850 RepID=A0A067BSY7_SAPPC|nr:hypothetical protein SPRG_13686 [Saprolegnia parasitica CBS 223.65]KDO21373.1 hypothetical protein SPRG_13686 [Saprolegnia parasitica CBS 223.65]|eukprot:XP_012207929.1 hypothetical protein SPRG_13686 [Saprolegnia parasitica CBS 223.65]